MAKLLLVFCNVAFTAAKITGQYSIPEPDIIAFEGGGLRVSIADDPGISLFRFHANVNEEMKQLYPGTVNIETAVPLNGKWILEDRSVQLEVGDILFYWIFIEKDRLGYVKQPVQFQIRELVPYDNKPPYQPERSTTLRTTTAMTPTSGTTCPIVTIHCPDPSLHTLSSLQEQITALNQKVDLISTITALQGQVDTLNKKVDGINNAATILSEVQNVSKTVEFIVSTLERLPDVKKLTMSGVLPPDMNNSPSQVVRLVLWEKLDLRVNITSAVRNKDSSIVFELKTLKEKEEVLKAAAEKLKGSRIVIN